MRFHPALLLPLLAALALCGCNRSPVPPQWRQHTLKIHVHNTQPPLAGEIDSTVGIEANSLRICSLGTPAVGTQDAQKHTLAVSYDITAITAAGAQVQVHLIHATGDDRKTLDQSFLVPYDKPVKETLLPGVVFESAFEKEPGI